MDGAMCADRSCPVRQYCSRYLAVPADVQWYADFATYRKGASCVGFVYASEYPNVRTWQQADEHNRRMETAIAVEDHKHDRRKETAQGGA